MNSITPMTLPLTLCPLAEQSRKRTRSAKLQPVDIEGCNFLVPLTFLSLQKSGTRHRRRALLSSTESGGEMWLAFAAITAAIEVYLLVIQYER
jgi:hypothetical protein